MAHGLSHGYLHWRFYNEFLKFAHILVLTLRCHVCTLRSFMMSSCKRHCTMDVVIRLYLQANVDGIYPEVLYHDVLCRRASCKPQTVYSISHNTIIAILLPIVIKKYCNNETVLGVEANEIQWKLSRTLHTLSTTTFIIRRNQWCF